MPFLRKICCIAVLYLWIWNSNIYAQSKALYMERTVVTNFGLSSMNPSMLQTLQDSMLLDVKAYYYYSKGDFKNYFSPDSYYKTGIQTESYNRLDSKTVVYGFASYNYSKGKNFSGTTFLDPYRVPFNFTPKTEDTKGDKRIEQYQLVGGISHCFATKWILGGKVDYKTINFAKLRDMRNVNDILDLTLNLGLAYQFSSKNIVGISYKYNRYIENMMIKKYGKTEKDYYALVNRGAFMGLFHLYGEKGILGGIKKPWVDLTHTLGLQYKGLFSRRSDFYLELNYAKGKGHFGNKSDESVVYMKHDKKSYSFRTQLNIKGQSKLHIISLDGKMNEISNYEQLYREVVASGGNSITQYYGENKISNRKHNVINASYNYLWGDTYQRAPWQIIASYTFNSIKRNTNYYPYYRKQNINWHTFDLGISRSIRCKKNDYLIKYSTGFVSGSGGEPKDGMFVNTGSSVPPDYLNHQLHKEKEYLTAKRLVSSLSFRIEHEYNKSTGIYLELNTTYTKPFNTKYLKGNFFGIGLTAGLAF